MAQIEEILLDEKFPLFSRPPTKNPQPPENSKSKTTVVLKPDHFDSEPQIEKSTNPNPGPNMTKFEDLGLADWAVRTCKELGMKKPIAVQSYCIPKILARKDVLGLAQTGSGKTAAFALPILHQLAEDPFGVFALVVMLTRELAYLLAEQFRALGSSLHLRCSVIVGETDMLTQAKSLMA